MGQPRDIKNDLVAEAKFAGFRIVVGLMALSLWMAATTAAVALASGYRLEVAVFCLGIVPLFGFLVIHTVLSRRSWQQLGHGIHYRNHPLFMLIPLAGASTLFLGSMIDKAGHLDWYHAWRARQSYLGSLPWSVECEESAVVSDGLGTANLFKLTGDTEAALNHLRTQLPALGLEPARGEAYTLASDTPSWWRRLKRNEPAQSLCFDHNDYGRWWSARACVFPDSDALYLEVIAPQ